MSDEFESERQVEDSGINPLGKWLIISAIVLVVIAAV